MSEEAADKQPIVRLTHLSIKLAMPRKSKQPEPEGRGYTVYGVDAQGVERVYVEHATEEEHQAWRAADPLWHEAQRTIFNRLLQNPRTRDVVTKINIKAALDQGDLETAAALMKFLSPQAWSELTGKDIHGNEVSAGVAACASVTAPSGMGQLGIERADVTKARGLIDLGFHCLGTIHQMVQEGIPNNDDLDSCGVYSVVALTGYRPAYLGPQEVKERGNVISPWSVDRLEKKWVTGAEVLYFSAAGVRGVRPLRDRLDDLRRHCMGNTTSKGPHKGGEILWQMFSYETFEVWYLATDGPPAPKIGERNLISAFTERAGKLPFGNRSLGPRLGTQAS